MMPPVDRDRFARDLHQPASVHVPCLVLALAVMLGVTAYPLVLMRANGAANEPMAMALFWAMSAGFVRGVGFIPRARVWQLVFSGWSCLAGLLLAACLRWPPAA